MSDSWLKFGCFLTGYKYEVIKHCSIASEKTVYKYTSAILLVCLIWGFVGYSFTSRYISYQAGNQLEFNYNRIFEYNLDSMTVDTSDVNYNIQLPELYVVRPKCTKTSFI